MTEESAIGEVKAAELARCRSVEEKDFGAMERLLADELRYRHSTGRVEDKTVYVSNLKTFRRAIKRDEMDVRIYGDVASLTGAYTITIWESDDDTNPRFVRADALQIWARRDGRWQLVAHQGTPIQEGQ